MSISDRIKRLERRTPRLPGFVLVEAGQSVSEALAPYLRAGLDPFTIALPGALP